MGGWSRKGGTCHPRDYVPFHIFNHIHRAESLSHQIPRSGLASWLTREAKLPLAGVTGIKNLDYPLNDFMWQWQGVQRGLVTTSMVNNRPQRAITDSAFFKKKTNTTVALPAQTPQKTSSTIHFANLKSSTEL